MSTVFPTSLDNNVDTVETEVLDEAGGIGLSQLLNNHNDQIEAIEAKVGVNSSSVTTSHDYKLSGVTGSDKAASKTGTETLTNKTLSSATNSIDATKLQTRTLAATAPTNGQAVVWSDANNQWEPGTVSGGGTPGGSDTQVQFNDGGSFGGDTAFTYNKTTDTATIGNLTIIGTSAGDGIGIVSPDSDSPDALLVKASTTVQAASGGNIDISAGSGGADGGTVTISAGSSTGSSFGGSIMLEPGSGSSGDGGVSIVDPTSSVLANIDTSSLATTDKTFTLPNATGTFVLNDNTATLTNKTLTSPKINEDVAITATATEINYTDGVTSAIQTQLNGKQPLDADLTTLATAFTTASASGAASLALAEDTDNGSNTVSISAPASVASNKTITLPDVAGTMAIVPGSDTQVVFNDGGALGTDSQLTYNKTTDTLTIGKFSIGGGTIQAADEAIPGQLNLEAGSSNSGNNGGGDVLVVAGDGLGTGDGGFAFLVGGEGVTGGSIILFPGAGSSTDGAVYVSNPSSSLSAILNTSSIASTDKTFTFPNATGTFVLNDNTATLTNKTLTSPVISTISNTGTLTLPTSTDTLVGRDTTDTLTNKTLTSPQIGGDADLDDATGNITVAGSDPKRTMYVPASAMFPSLTAPCSIISQVESATNDVNIKVLAFDGAGTSKEYAEFGIQSPSYWDASTVTAQFVWYAAAGSGTVNWEIQGLALSDDDALDTAYGTLQEVTDTLTAVGDVHITAETSAITIAGTPVAGDWLQFKIARDPNNDTDTSDALLMGVRIRFGIKQYNDS